MRILVDTHVVLWAAVDDDRLSSAHRALYTNPSNALVVSVASLWEIAIKVGLGKLPLPVPPADFFAREVASRGYEVLDIRRPHAERVGLLRYPPGGHRDPFDRMLVAQSLVEGLPLMSADMRLRDYVDQGVLLV